MIGTYIYFCSLLHRHDLSFGPLDEVISCGHSTETSSAERGHVPFIFCFLAKSGEFLRIFVVANGVINWKRSMDTQFVSIWRDVIRNWWNGFLCPWDNNMLYLLIFRSACFKLTDQRALWDSMFSNIVFSLFNSVLTADPKWNKKPTSDSWPVTLAFILLLTLKWFRVKSISSFISLISMRYRTVSCTIGLVVYWNNTDILLRYFTTVFKQMLILTVSRLQSIRHLFTALVDGIFDYLW